MTSRLPDYALADASIESNFGRLEVRLMVRNVTGRRIATFGKWAENPMDPGSPVQRFLTPGQPCNVEVSVSADF